MTTPSVEKNIVTNTDQQNQLGIGQGPSGIGVINITRNVGQQEASIKEHTFVHSLRQSICTNGLGAGCTVVSNENNKLCYQYDFGANYLPYNKTRAAVREEELVHYLPWCNSYEIVSHGYSISNCISYKDDVQADGRIVSTFMQDTVEVFSGGAKFRPMNVVHIDRNKSLFECNSGFRHVEPTSLNDMTLPRCAVRFSPELYNATTNEAKRDLKRGMFDPYHGLFKVSTWNTLQPLKFNYELNSGRIPTGLFDGCTRQPCNKTIIAAANRLLDTVYGVQANMATQVNRAPIIPAPIHMLRLVPIWQTMGLTERRSVFDVTYSCHMKFHYSGRLGSGLLHLGNQGQRLAHPYDDLMDQVAQDPIHYHPGVHAEKFVIPMTGYVINENQKRSDLSVPEPVIPDRSTVKTSTDEIIKQLQDEGYTIEEELVNNVSATTKITTPFNAADKDGELKPEFRKPMLKALGVNDNDIEEFQKWVKEFESDDIDPEKGAAVKLKDNLVVDAANKPKLPVSASIDLPGNIQVSNLGYLRPGEAWRALGADKLPSNPRRDGQGYYTPWPVGVSISPGRRHCSMNSLMRVKGLNRQKIQQLNNINRVIEEASDNDNVRMDLSGDASNYQELAQTLPLEVTGIRQGPQLQEPRYATDVALQNQYFEGATGTSEDLKEKGYTATKAKYSPY